MTPEQEATFGPEPQHMWCVGDGHTIWCVLEQLQDQLAAVTAERDTALRVVEAARALAAAYPNTEEQDNAASAVVDAVLDWEREHSGQPS